ncbi:hypothetical protein CDL15_Pgr017996 [Punica granatum]|uniref:Uncharacterized protein n=1 Tax=Punica granatum TaxID=22663 RepID=A0A218WHS7_PUNGR|nr:hypothetical protein CDL15_Pgr017996 [Punica granatum]PKI56876.1 hypothetical protein CRG98_022705 [Punica granatum]
MEESEDLRSLRSDFGKDLADLISETTQTSKDLAVEASKAVDQLKLAALKQADQLRFFFDAIAPQIASSFTNAGLELRVTADLKDFVKEFNATTFQSFHRSFLATTS